MDSSRPFYDHFYLSCFGFRTHFLRFSSFSSLLTRIFPGSVLSREPHFGGNIFLDRNFYTCGVRPRQPFFSWHRVYVPTHFRLKQFRQIIFSLKKVWGGKQAPLPHSDEITQDFGLCPGLYRKKFFLKKILALIFQELYFRGPHSGNLCQTAFFHEWKIFGFDWNPLVDKITQKFL